MRPAGRREPVQRFLVKHHRDPEPGVREHPFLNVVDELGMFARVAASRALRCAADLARPRDLSDPEAQDFLRRGWREATVGVLNVFLVDPEALQLRDFFFDRHAPQQIRNAHVHGSAGVLVGRRSLRRRDRHHRRPTPPIRLLLMIP